MLEAEQSHRPVGKWTEKSKNKNAPSQDWTHGFTNYSLMSWSSLPLHHLSTYMLESKHNIYCLLLDLCKYVGDCDYTLRWALGRFRYLGIRGGQIISDRRFNTGRSWARHRTDIGQSDMGSMTRRRPPDHRPISKVAPTDNFRPDIPGSRRTPGRVSLFVLCTQSVFSFNLPV